MKVMNIFIIVLILMVLVLAGCGGDDSDDTIIETEETDGVPDKTLTITIGNITDLTGP